MYKKHDREVVLKKGLQLLCAKGYANLGVDEICKETGMTKGAFYNAFESKENFLLLGISEYGQNTVQFLRKRLSREGSSKKAIDRLRSMYNHMFDQQTKRNFRGCMINNMMTELGALNPAVGKATAREFDQLVAAIEPCVKEAQADGDLTADIESMALTELLHTSFFGTLTRAKSTQNARQGKQTMTTLINSLAVN